MEVPEIVEQIRVLGRLLQRDLVFPHGAGEIALAVVENGKAAADVRRPKLASQFVLLNRLRWVAFLVERLGGGQARDRGLGRWQRRLHLRLAIQTRVESMQF